MVGMTPVAFSRFFRLRTGKTLSDYIIDIRIGFASRLLVDSVMSIAEICYECGFNNLSNFNRMFILYLFLSIDYIIDCHRIMLIMKVSVIKINSICF